MSENIHQKFAELTKDLTAPDVTAGHVFVYLAIARASRKLDSMPVENRTCLGLQGEVDIQLTRALEEFGAPPGAQSMCQMVLTSWKTLILDQV